MKSGPQQELLWSDSEPGRPTDIPEKPQRVSKALQDVLIREGLWAIDRALQHQNFSSLQVDLEANLPQNSAQTRARYTQSLLRWFFPEGQVDGLATKVWKAYRDENLEIEILRVLYLRAESIIGDCVAEALFPIQEGATVPASYLFNYLRGKLGSLGVKTQERLKTNLRRIGFLVRMKDGRDVLKPMNPSGTAFILLFHHLFAPREIRTLELRSILADNFWRHLGVKSEDSIRRLFRDAMQHGLIGKYIIADRIEFVTTRCTLDELLINRVQL